MFIWRLDNNPRSTWSFCSKLPRNCDVDQALPASVLLHFSSWVLWDESFVFVQRYPDTLQMGFGPVFLTQAAVGTRSSQTLQGAGSKLWAHCTCKTHQRWAWRSLPSQDETILQFWVHWRNAYWISQPGCPGCVPLWGSGCGGKVACGRQSLPSLAPRGGVNTSALIPIAESLLPSLDFVPRETQGWGASVQSHLSGLI